MHRYCHRHRHITATPVSPPCIRQCPLKPIVAGTVTGTALNGHGHDRAGAHTSTRQVLDSSSSAPPLLATRRSRLALELGAHSCRLAPL